MTTHTTRHHRPAGQPRSRIVIPIIAALAVAAALIAVAILQTRSSSNGNPAGPSGTSAAPIDALLRGIPQQGSVLGRAGAPVTLIEFADLQCPACKVWEESTLPTLVRRYVREGRLRIEFRGAAIVGPDSVTALRYLAAARAQGKMWPFILNAYAHQGTENAWVSPAALEAIGREVGLDPQRLTADANPPATTSQLMEWARDGIRSTPTLVIGSTGSGRYAPIALQSLSAEGTIPAVEQALAAAR